MRVHVFYMFLSGAIMMACFVAEMFFGRFYNRMRDRFFAILALAFAIMGVERILLALRGGPIETSPLVYFMSLLALGAIILAVVDKNLASRSNPE